jgi:hypothetical protein
VRRDKDDSSKLRVRGREKSPEPIKGKLAKMTARLLKKSQMCTGAIFLEIANRIFQSFCLPSLLAPAQSFFLFSFLSSLQETKRSPARYCGQIILFLKTCKFPHDHVFDVHRCTNTFLEK